MNDERTIGHYRIVEQLGSGAMGTVHVAVDTFIDRPVAIKSLRPELSRDPDFVSRFRAEAKSLARLNHPNIATLYSPLLDGDDLYMVMELVRGKPLDDVMQERAAPLGVKECLAVIAQAADGLSYAHEIGVIHRDVKPSNLMIANDGRVKIMDFGIARVRGSQRLTKTGTAVGTPLYMSPEQCRGGEGDERSDIYSLAIVLYEMLTGAPPFAADTEYDLVQAQINAPPPPLVAKVPGVTPQLEAAIMKALEKKPENRFESMRAFSDAVGATALRPDANTLVRSAAHLVETPQIAAETAPRTSTVDIAVSRLSAFKRRLANLHPAAQGAGAVLALAAITAPIYLVFFDGRDGGKPKAERAQAGAEAQLGDLRAAIKGESTTRIRASDFDRLADSAKAPLLPAARKLAREGVAEAQFVLGMLLLETPNRQDIDGAFDSFGDAARQNYPDAQANMAMLYQKGLLRSGRDYDKASAWFRQAADNGDAKAQFWLGCYYQFGWGGLSKDPRKASEQYEKAATSGYVLAKEARDLLSGANSGQSPCLK
jgi:eukaryotic-like serine/threonine-protein kinase